MTLAVLHLLGAGHRQAKTTVGPATTVDTERVEVPASVVIRRINLRPVAAFAFTFLLVVAILVVGAAIATWMILERAGAIDHMERLIVDLGFETFQIEPAPLLHILVLGAGAAVVVGTVLAVLAAVVFNLVNRFVGGISLSIVERFGRERRQRRPHPR